MEFSRKSEVNISHTQHNEQGKQEGWWHVTFQDITAMFIYIFQIYYYKLLVLSIDICAG